MEISRRLSCPPEVACWGYLEPDPTIASPDEPPTPAWDDEILRELREQAGAGCFLCSFEQWNEEEDDDDA